VSVHRMLHDTGYVSALGASGLVGGPEWDAATAQLTDLGEEYRRPQPRRAKAAAERVGPSSHPGYVIRAWRVARRLGYLRAVYKTDWSAPAAMGTLDRLLLNRIDAHGRIAQAAPRSSEWEAAIAHLEDAERRLRSLRIRPLALPTA
jgi:hypothetical protein